MLFEVKAHVGQKAKNLVTRAGYHARIITKQQFAPLFYNDVRKNKAKDQGAGFGIS